MGGFSGLYGSRAHTSPTYLCSVKMQVKSFP